MSVCEERIDPWTRDGTSSIERRSAWFAIGSISLLRGFGQQPRNQQRREISSSDINALPTLPLSLNCCLVLGGQILKVWWLKVELWTKDQARRCVRHAGQGLAWRFYGKHQTQNGAAFFGQLERLLIGYIKVHVDGACFPINS